MTLNRFAVPLAFVLLIIVALYLEKEALRHKGAFTARPVPERDGAVMFTWADAVEAPMAVRLETLFDEWRGRADIIIIDLSSPGGSLREGGKVIDVIDEMKKTHTVETRVGRNRVCLSMCVPIFLQGDYRVASRNSRWMFHEPISTDAVTGEEVARPEFEKTYVSNKFFDDYFSTSEMDPVWRERLRKEWVGREIWKSGDELVAEGSNIINALI